MGLQGQGRIEGLRQAVLSALRARFELVPRDLVRSLTEISELALLEQLLHVSVRAESLDEFRAKMRLVLGE